MKPTIDLTIQKKKYMLVENWFDVRKLMPWVISLYAMWYQICRKNDVLTPGIMQSTDKEWKLRLSKSKSSDISLLQWPVFFIIKHIIQTLLKLQKPSWDQARKDWSPLKVSTHINSNLQNQFHFHTFSFCPVSLDLLYVQWHCFNKGIVRAPL